MYIYISHIHKEYEISSVPHTQYPTYPYGEAGGHIWCYPNIRHIHMVYGKSDIPHIHRAKWTLGMLDIQYQILMDTGPSKSHIDLGYCLSNISQGDLGSLISNIIHDPGGYWIS